MARLAMCIVLLLLPLALTDEPEVESQATEEPPAPPPEAPAAPADPPAPPPPPPPPIEPVEDNTAKIAAVSARLKGAASIGSTQTSDELREIIEEAESIGVSSQDIALGRQAVALRVETELKNEFEAIQADNDADPDSLLHIADRAEERGASTAFVEKARAASKTQREKQFLTNVNNAVAEQDPDQIENLAEEASHHGIAVEKARDAARSLRLTVFKQHVEENDDSELLVDVANQAETHGLLRADVDTARNKAITQASTRLQRTQEGDVDHNELREAIRRAEHAGVVATSVSAARMVLSKLAAAELAEAMKGMDEKFDVPILQTEQFHRFAEAIQRAQTDGVDALQLQPAAKLRNEKITAAITDHQSRRDIRGTWDAVNSARSMANDDLKDTILTAMRRLRLEVNETFHGAANVVKTDRERLRAAVDVGLVGDDEDLTEEDHHRHQAASELLGAEDHRDSIRENLRGASEGRDFAALVHWVQEGRNAHLPDAELKPFADEATREVTLLVQHAANESETSLDEVHHRVELAATAGLPDNAIASARNRLVQDAKKQLSEASSGNDLNALYHATELQYLAEVDRSSSQALLKTKVLSILDTWSARPDVATMRAFIEALNFGADGRIPEFPEASLVKARAALRSELLKEIPAASQAASSSMDALPRLDQALENADSSSQHWGDGDEQEVQTVQQSIDAARPVYEREHDKQHWLQHLEAHFESPNAAVTRDGLREAKNSGLSHLQLQRFEDNLAKKELVLKGAREKLSVALAAKVVEGLREAVNEADEAGLNYEEGDQDLINSAHETMAKETEKTNALSELEGLSGSMRQAIERAQRAGVAQTDIIKYIPSASAPSAI